MQCPGAHPELLKLVVLTWRTSERELQAAVRLGESNGALKLGRWMELSLAQVFDKAAVDNRSGSLVPACWRMVLHVRYPEGLLLTNKYIGFINRI